MVSEKFVQLWGAKGPTEPETAKDQTEFTDMHLTPWVCDRLGYILVSS